MNAAYHKSCPRRSSGLKLLASAALGVIVAMGLALSPAVASAASSYDFVTAEIPVTVEATGDVADETQTFTFEIEPTDDEEAAPDQPEVSIDGGGEAAFTITTDEVGVYTYTVRQVVGGADRWSYDNQTYNVTVYVYNMGSQDADALKTLVIIVDGEGYKAESCAFANSYEAVASDASDPDTTTSASDASGSPAAADTSDAVSAADASTATEDIASAIGSLFPKTGDSINLGLVAAIALIGVVAAVILIVAVVKRRH